MSSAELTSTLLDSKVGKYFLRARVERVMDETTEQTEVRRQKLLKLKSAGAPLYPNDFKPEHLSADIAAEYGALPDDRLAALDRSFTLAGRIMALRSFGK